MTVNFTMSWWWIPVALVVLAFVVPNIWPGKSRGDYDLFTPLVAAGVFLVFISAAIAFTVGYFIGV